MTIDHAALYVKNLERAKVFFETYFGAVSNEKYHNKTTGFESYFLTFEDHTRLEIMTKPELSEHEKSPVSWGFIHLAFNTGSKEQVDLLTARLKADGYQVISGPRTTGDGYYESCILDAEGNQIEITV